MKKALLKKVVATMAAESFAENQKHHKSPIK